MSGRRSSGVAGISALAGSKSAIRFHAKLLRPVGVSDSEGWSFLRLPQGASAELPARGMVSVEGEINGRPFVATLEPDGEGGHWLRVDRELSQAANLVIGDTVSLAISPVTVEPEPRVPSDLETALGEASEARAVWSDLTPLARRDWIQWITSGKRAETRVSRIETALSKLAAGKRRPCCFDRSGMYDKSLSCPLAEPDPTAEGSKRVESRR